MSTPTRSTLRSIDAAFDGRWRRYKLRWGLVCLSVAALIWFCLAIGARTFSSGGFGWIVYVLHDAVYIPLKGAVWTRWFPYAFVWLVPLSMIVALALTEFLSKSGPVRALHRRLILRIAARPGLQRLLAPKLGTRQIDAVTWAQSLTSEGITQSRLSGFARSVIRKEQDSLWMRLAVGLADGQAANPRQMKKILRLTGLRLRLDPSDAKVHLRALEVIATDPALSQQHDFVREYQQFLNVQRDLSLARPIRDALETLIALDGIDSQDAIAQAYAGTAEFGHAIQTPTQVTPHQVLDMACIALVVFKLGSRHELQDVRGFQRLWFAARLSQTPEGVSDVLGMSETLIFFEMWSKLAEIGPEAPQSRGLLTRALADTGAEGMQRIEAAEAFAWGKGQS